MPDQENEREVHELILLVKNAATGEGPPLTTSDLYEVANKMAAQRTALVMLSETTRPLLDRIEGMLYEIAAIITEYRRAEGEADPIECLLKIEKIFAPEKEDDQ